jgi:hypothetical protein
MNSRGEFTIPIFHILYSIACRTRETRTHPCASNTEEFSKRDLINLASENMQFSNTACFLEFFDEKNRVTRP